MAYVQEYSILIDIYLNPNKPIIMYTLIENRGYEQFIVLDGTMDECLSVKRDMESIEEETKDGMLIQYCIEEH